MLAMAMACGSPTIAGAEVRIEGDPTAVRVATSEDTIADVLSALGAAFKLRYRSAISLDAAAGPAYSGSIRQVIAHLLDGYNYLVKSDQETTEIIVLGARGQVAIPPPPARAPKAAAPTDIVSRWR